MSKLEIRAIPRIRFTLLVAMRFEYKNDCSDSYLSSALTMSCLSWLQELHEYPMKSFILESGIPGHDLDSPGKQGSLPSGLIVIACFK